MCKLMLFTCIDFKFHQSVSYRFLIGFHLITLDSTEHTTLVGCVNINCWIPTCAVSGNCVMFQSGATLVDIRSKARPNWGSNIIEWKGPLVLRRRCCRRHQRGRQTTANQSARCALLFHSSRAPSKSNWIENLIQSYRASARNRKHFVGLLRELGMRRRLIVLWCVYGCI